MKRHHYTLRLLTGRLLLNGRPVATIIDGRERTCDVLDPGDRLRLAQLAFEAGVIAARRDATLPTPHARVAGAAPGRRRR